MFFDTDRDTIRDALHVTPYTDAYTTRDFAADGLPDVPWPADFDPYAGGYPVPPMPGQVLPELVSVVAGTQQADDDEAEPADTEGKDA